MPEQLTPWPKPFIKGADPGRNLRKKRPLIAKSRAKARSASTKLIRFWRAAKPSSRKKSIAVPEVDEVGSLVYLAVDGTLRGLRRSQ
jgi:hypothetical protein